LPPKLLVPYSKEAWGYGNCIDFKEFEVISRNSQILKSLKNILGDNFEFNHIMVNRKAPWIGPEVEYHQEVFNSKTFAPGAHLNELREKWCQIYIPLDSENSSNGGLRVITNSHLLGELKSEDMVNQNYSHKRRVPANVLSEVVNSDDCELKDLDLQAGDCLFFSPLLVHGSPSNGTPNERVSLVIQARVKPFVPNTSIFEKEVEYRNSFIIDSFLKNVEEIDENNKNKYSDFKSM
jgi:ectoine hydroxylase-related dioxygenase (phytanoyl-CoA dioxygenase family)